MIYPFIYTRTKYHDYRVVTSKLLHNLQLGYVGDCRSIACAAIDATTQQLQKPSWVLVKSQDSILWGLACSNALLGSSSEDRDRRPVRGFFGVILSSDTKELPYNLNYFRRLYDTYVSPIWEAVVSNEEIISPLDIPFGNSTLVASRKEPEVNFTASTSKIFPWRENVEDYIATVLATMGCNSIATNIHKHDQILNVGMNDFSFMNVIMAEDSRQTRIENVAISDSQSGFVTREENRREENDAMGNTRERICESCGKSLLSSETSLCEACTRKESHKRLIKSCLYGFVGLICLILLFKGGDIWKTILSAVEQHTEIIDDAKNTNRSQGQNGSKGYDVAPPDFAVSRQKIIIEDASTDDVYTIIYQGNAKISITDSPKWLYVTIDSSIHAIQIQCAPSNQLERQGIINVTDGTVTQSITVIQRSSSVQYDVPTSQTDKEVDKSFGIESKQHIQGTVTTVP